MSKNDLNRFKRYGSVVIDLSIVTWLEIFYLVDAYKYCQSVMRGSTKTVLEVPVIKGNQ